MGKRVSMPEYCICIFRIYVFVLVVSTVSSPRPQTAEYINKSCIRYLYTKKQVTHTHNKNNTTQHTTRTRPHMTARRTTPLT